MPRPEERPPIDMRKAAIVAVIVLALALCAFAASCSMGEDASDASDAGQEAALPGQSTQDGPLADDTTDVTKDAKVGGLKKLDFLGTDGKADFVSALRKYMTENDLAWTSGAKVASVKNRTDTTARVFVKLDGGAWLVCYWVKDTSAPFLFEATTKEEATSADDTATGVEEGAAVTQPADPATSQPVTGDTTDGNVATDAGTTETSTAAGVAASRQTNPTGSGAAQSNSTPTSQKTTSASSASKKKAKKDVRRRDVAKTPVKASDAEGLERKLPEEAALTLATAIGNYMAKHDVKVDGKTATIDLSSVRKTKEGLSFYGYVTDHKGRVHYLDAEWNTGKRQFGMATYR